MSANTNFGLQDIEGFEELQKQLKKLPDKIKIRELQRLFIKVSLPMRRTLKAKVAPHTRKKPVRVRKRRSNKPEPKYGLLIKSVGYKRGTQAPVLAVGFKSSAPHANLFEHGTTERYTKKGVNRGKMPSFGVVESTFDQHKNTMISESGKQVAKMIQKTIDRLSK